MRTNNSSFLDCFQKSLLFETCFVRDASAELDEVYFVKIYAEAPNTPDYLIGSVGDSLGTPERFKVIACPDMLLAVGEEATIIKINPATMELPYPTFAGKHYDYNGYKNISSRYKAPSYRVGRLVASVWLPQPEGTNVVDHIDNNRSNDFCTNLAWVSYSENVRRSRTGKRRRWNDDDFALLVHREKGALICHPRKIASISGSRNLSAVLNIPNRHSLHGWYPLINPSLEDALDFIATLPFEVDKEDITSLFEGRVA